MNFLQLAQRVRQECGVSGSGPASVLNQTGELARLVSWTSQAYVDLQNKKNNWRWMRSKFTVNTVASTDAYAYGSCTDTIASASITRFKRWYPQEFQIYLTSSGIGTSHYISYVFWDEFKRVWKVGSQNNGYPAVVTIDPQNNFVLGPVPDAIYTVTGDYHKSAQTLALDADIPEMPTDFHMLIVYLAMKKYAAYEGAPEVWANAKDEYKQMLGDLMVDQLPAYGYAGPLA